jgi:hypothetical protein
MSGQSALGGNAASRRAATSTKRHEAAMAYRKHAYQIGGTAATPTLISGQLIAQLDVNKARRTWWRCGPLTPL